jgi:hypothetical protein
VTGERLLFWRTSSQLIARILIRCVNLVNLAITNGATRSVCSMSSKCIYTAFKCPVGVPATLRGCSSSHYSADRTSILARKLVAPNLSRTRSGCYATAQEQEIINLPQEYCDGFKCDSSPYVEQTIRSFARGVLRQSRWSPQLFAEDVLYKVWTQRVAYAMTCASHGFRFFHTIYLTPFVLQHLLVWCLSCFLLHRHIQSRSGEQLRVHQLGMASSHGS